MAETRSWSLSPAEQTEAVSLATRRLRRADYLLEKDIWVDYRAAVSGRLQLVPTGTAREQLAKDHRLMVESGILLDDWEPFEELMDACADLERRANGR